MNFQEYQDETGRTGQFNCQQDALLCCGLGLAGEAGEVADIIKKYAFHGHDLDRDKIKLELGDVLWYLASLATHNGLTLEEIAQANLEKLWKRYPHGFNHADSKNRVE